MAKGKSNNAKERIVVFGNTIDEDKQKTWHTHDDGGSLVGIAFLVGGILLLLNTFAIIPWTVWNTIWPFWPLLLIYFGLHIIVGNSAFLRWVVKLIGVLFIVLVMLFAIYQVRPQLLHDMPYSLIQFFDTMKGWQK